MPTHPSRVSSDIVREFDDHGFVILKGILGDDAIDGVRAELNHWIDDQAESLCEQGINDSRFEDLPFDTRLIRVFEKCPDRLPQYLRTELHLAGMHALFFHAGLLDIAEAMLGPEVRLYPNYTIRPKIPDDPKTVVLWHQDAGYTASGAHGNDPNAEEMTFDMLKMVNVWAPLVPARRENGCMQFVPGTHKLGLVEHEWKNEYYLEIVPEALEPQLENAIDVILDPGDVVLFSNLLFHMGQPNHSNTIRWSADWRYQDARQSTLRSERGFIARSRSDPASEVESAEHWAELSFS